MCVFKYRFVLILVVSISQLALSSDPSPLLTEPAKDYSLEEYSYENDESLLQKQELPLFKGEKEEILDFLLRKASNPTYEISVDAFQLPVLSLSKGRFGDLRLAARRGSIKTKADNNVTEITAKVVIENSYFTCQVRLASSPLTASVKSIFDKIVLKFTLMVDNLDKPDLPLEVQVEVDSLSKPTFELPNNIPAIVARQILSILRKRFERDVKDNLEMALNDHYSSFTKDE